MENPPPKPYWHFIKQDFYAEPSFQTLLSYPFKHILNRLLDRCLHWSSDVTELVESKKQGKNDMKKCLAWIDILWLGFGSVVGPRIFTITGLEAHDDAGPFASVSFLFFRIEFGDFVAFIAAALLGLMSRKDMLLKS
nr:hypothetical protein [Tanacetum cinerariifolium]